MNDTVGGPGNAWWRSRRVADRLPEFPWDTLAAAGRRARAHPGGVVDLSVGTPVDDTPAVVQDALAAASNSPGYPLTYGTADVRAAVVRWLGRRFGVTALAAADVLPTLGSKELVATLPWWLGIGPGDAVAFPALAYPTYEVGAMLAGAQPVRVDTSDLDAVRALDPSVVKMLWVNSPANPHGAVLDAATLAGIVAWCRENGVLLVSDECYLEFSWDAAPVSALHPDVCGGSSEGILTVHSLSKRSNLAGYRAAFVAGDHDVVAALLAVRKHGGMIAPGPVQAALIAALDDDAHVEEQRERYARRRAVLRPALEAAGWRIDHSEGSLYLWATRDDLDAWGSVDALAELGILVAAGTFYGDAGGRHVRVALTNSDERIGEAARRLRERASSPNG